jgi:hypothetical protein
MFRLNKEEQAKLIFHFGTSSWGGTRKLSMEELSSGTLLTEVGGKCYVF